MPRAAPRSHGRTPRSKDRQRPKSRPEGKPGAVSSQPSASKPWDRHRPFGMAKLTAGPGTDPSVTITLQIEREAAGWLVVDIPGLVSMARGRSVAEAVEKALQTATEPLIVRLTGALEARLHLEIGSRYTARDGTEWICCRVDPYAARWCQATCVKVIALEVMSKPDDLLVARHFFIDGSHEEGGFSLIAQVKP